MQKNRVRRKWKHRSVSPFKILKRMEVLAGLHDQDVQTRVPVVAADPGEERAAEAAEETVAPAVRL